MEIDYPGINNYSQFSFDGLSRNTKIVETVSGSVTSTKQFVWGSDKLRRYRPCEERDGSGALTRSFFFRGEIISGASYLYGRNHLGSVTEITDSIGSIQGQYAFDPYGRPTTLQGSIQSDFQFARCYVHQRSGLNLTLRRAYSSQLGRFLRRDPIDERGGLNLFAYVSNEPNLWSDPSGLKKQPGRVRYNEGEADPINPGGDDGDHGEGEHYVPPPPPPKKPDCVPATNCSGRATREFNPGDPTDKPCNKGSEGGNCCKDTDGTIYDSCGKPVCDSGPRHDQPPPPPNPAGA